jgi:DNA-binding transcriptional regulator YhcF (GntR family)
MNTEVVVRDLRRRIESGEFSPGAPLPTLAALHREYATSSAEQVRQALASLADQQVVTEVRGLGFVVGGLPGREDDADSDDFAEARDRLDEDLTALKALLANDAVMWQRDRSGDEDLRSTEATAVVELGATLPSSGALRQVPFTKTWTGGLVGTSQGVVLHVGDPDADGGHVSVEVFEGSLDGREGTMALQRYHSTRGSEPQLVCEIVPGSGTGQLTGISGTGEVDVDGDDRRVTFVYRTGKRP